MRLVEVIGEVHRSQQDGVVVFVGVALGDGAKVDNYTDANGTTYDNYYTILLAPVYFADYLD